MQEITMNVCTDGEAPAYEAHFYDGNRPVITGVSGSLANGSELIIDGFFSAENASDKWNFAEQDQTLGAEVVPGYFVTDEDSFIGTGKCLKSVWPVGLNGSAYPEPIIPFAPHSECDHALFRKFVVTRWGSQWPDWNAATAYAVNDIVRYFQTNPSPQPAYVGAWRRFKRLVAGTTATSPDYDFTNWTDDIGDSESTPQIKTERALVVSGGHKGGNAMTLKWQSDLALPTDAPVGVRQQSVGSGSDTGYYGVPTGSTMITEQFDSWVLSLGYYKANTGGVGGVADGAQYRAFKNTASGNFYFNFNSTVGDYHYSDQSKTGNLPTFFEYRYNNVNTDAGFNGMGDGFWLPFYKREQSEITVYVDGLVINDTPESVWLCSHNNIDTALTSGKVLKLPQVAGSRTTTQVKVKFYLGNFSPEDDIYLTVRNSNGKFNDYYLLRAGA